MKSLKDIRFVVCSLLLFAFLVGCNECEKEQTFYDNGNIKTDVKICNGELEGIAKSFFENGNLESTSNWIEGVLNGYVVRFYPNGKVKDSTKMLNDIPHGKYVAYDKKGRISRIGLNKNRIFSGKDVDYTNSGDTSAINHYKNGGLDYYRLFYKDHSEKWNVKATHEECFIDYNDDTLQIGDTFKAKFTLNHIIADSIRIYQTSAKSKYNSDLLFKWPEENSTKYLYTKTFYKEGDHSFEGNVKVFYKDKFELEDTTFNFIINLYVKGK